MFYVIILHYEKIQVKNSSHLKKIKFFTCKITVCYKSHMGYATYLNKNCDGHVDKWPT